MRWISIGKRGRSHLFPLSSRFGVRPFSLYGRDLLQNGVRILRSGYAEEYEIKISASDLRAEAKKLDKYRDLQEGIQHYLGGAFRADYKIEPILDGALCAPYEVCGPRSDYRRTYVRIPYPIRRFYLVVPTDDLAVIAESVVPSFAGLLVVKGRWDIKERRMAMNLPHSRKATPAEINHVLSRMAYRYYLQYFGHEKGAGRK